jgi:hypothetical protein
VGTVKTATDQAGGAVAVFKQMRRTTARRLVLARACTWLSASASVSTGQVVLWHRGTRMWCPDRMSPVLRPKGAIAISQWSSASKVSSKNIGDIDCVRIVLDVG